jgi:hypothetical protein
MELFVNYLELLLELLELFGITFGITLINLTVIPNGITFGITWNYLENTRLFFSCVLPLGLLEHVFEKNCSIEFINPVCPSVHLYPIFSPSFNLLSIYEEYGCVFRSIAQEFWD